MPVALFFWCLVPVDIGLLVTICTYFQQMREDVKKLYTGQGLFVVPAHAVGYTVAIENSMMKAVKKKR